MCTFKVWKTTPDVWAALALRRTAEYWLVRRGCVLGKGGPGCVVVWASDLQQPIMSEDHMITSCFNTKLCKPTPFLRHTRFEKLVFTFHSDCAADQSAFKKHTHSCTHTYTQTQRSLTLLQVQLQWRVQWVQRALIRAQVAAKSVSHITRTAIKSAAALKKWMRAWVRLQMVHNCNSWAKPTVSISPVLLGCCTPNNFYILYCSTATHSGLKPRVQTFMWMLINTKHLPKQTAPTTPHRQDNVWFYTI